MEMNRSAVNATGYGEFKRDHFSSLLDELVCMRWDLIHRLHDSADLPAILAAHLKRVDDELEVTISTLGALIRKQQFPE